MVPNLIQRTLWYDDEESRIEIDQEQLSSKAESIVVLGEAGMGKTSLLKWISESEGVVYCTAKSLIVKAPFDQKIADAKVIVIDALDEVSAKNEGDAIDQIVGRLVSLGYPRFILSCRVADWHSANAMTLLDGGYEIGPLILHLNPFQDSDILSYLSAGLGDGHASIVIDHFNNLGLNSLLSNPQTLSMISDVSKVRLPKNKEELYQLAVENLASEHNDKKERTQLTVGAAIEAAGAAFAGLILTNKAAISRKAIANVNQDDCSLTDLALLPDAECLNKALDTRLFLSVGNDRFSYVHRSIGEYLGSKWLSNYASSARQKRRLLSMFQSYGLVPASLRGIHAWLMQAPELTEDVISFDPIGVIEYAGTENLNLDQARVLLASLKQLVVEYPEFNEWKSYSARGLIKEELSSEIISYVADKNLVFSLRQILIEAFQGSSLIERFEQQLETIILDINDIFAIRSRALDLYSEIKDSNKWEAIVRKLYFLSNSDSLRLASEFLRKINFVGMPAELIVDVSIRYTQCNDNSVMKLYYVGRELPINLISEVLDIFSDKLPPMRQWYGRSGNHYIVDCVCTLMSRLIESNDVDPKKLWNWIRLINLNTDMPGGEFKKLVSLIDSKGLREKIHFSIFFEDGINIGEKNIEIQLAFPDLAVTEDDAIKIFSQLDPADKNDIRWKEIVQLYYHNQEHGQRARMAALKFAEHHEDGIQWLEDLGNPEPTEREVKKRQASIQAKKEKEYRLHKNRDAALSNIDSIKSGEISWLVNLAKAYCKVFSDVGNDMPAHERIADWLGDEVSAAAFVGFETYFKAEVMDVDDIAKVHANNRYYPHDYILIAAVSERIRKGFGLDGLSNETLLGCLFLYWNHCKFTNRIKFDYGLDAIEKAVNNRKLIAEAYRRYIEPQLILSKDLINGLWQLMSDVDLNIISVTLASEWLVKFPKMSSDIECVLLKKLVSAGAHEKAKSYLSSVEFGINEEINLNRLAVYLIVDFEKALAKIDGHPPKALLFSLRKFLPDQYSIRLAEWIVEEFRLFWPYTPIPEGSSIGDQNGWDATRFINQLIEGFAHDSSREAVGVLTRLRDQSKDEYDGLIQNAFARQRQYVVEKTFILPDLKTIKAVTTDSKPHSIDDLQAYMLEELRVVQTKIKSDDVDSWRGFYDDKNNPYEEERCRDYLLGLLRQNVDKAIQYAPEAHVAADKRVDITCSTSGVRLPIEVKGQWHDELWVGADKQLDKLYTPDYLANGRGIYLVLWFGLSCGKKLKSRGRDERQPQTPDELKEMLTKDSSSAQSGLVKIVVLDLERNS